MSKLPKTNPNQAFRFLSELKKVAKKYIVHDVSDTIKAEAFLENRQFNHFMNLLPGIVCLIDLQSLQYVYISGNVKSILGYPPDDFYKGGIEKALSLCSPAHNDVMIKDVFPTMFEYFTRSTSSEDVYDVKVAYTNQLSKKDGSYQWFLHQASIFHADENGKPLFMLKTVSDIDFLKDDDTLSMTLYKKCSNGLFKTVSSRIFLGNKEKTVLSERETEVLTLMGQGKSSREIADQLFISEHTVYNHRKNMLKKMEVKRTGELVKKAIATGVI